MAVYLRRVLVAIGRGAMRASRGLSKRFIVFAAVHWGTRVPLGAIIVCSCVAVVFLREAGDVFRVRCGLAVCGHSFLLSCNVALWFGRLWRWYFEGPNCCLGILENESGG